MNAPLFVRACRRARPARAGRIACAVAIGALVLGALGCGGGLNRPIAPASPQDQLRLAQLNYDQREYSQAISLLQGYIQYRAGASDLDEAHFLLGMCYVQRKEWPLAAGEFLIVASDFSASPRAPDAHYWLGMSYWKQARGPQFDQDQTRRAIAQWDRFLELYPTHPRGDEARALRLEGRDRLAEKALKNGRLYVTLHHWGPARFYFQQVLDQFPDSHWVDQARVGVAETLRGEGKLVEARGALEAALPELKDPEAKRRAEELLKKIGHSAEGAPG